MRKELRPACDHLAPAGWVSMLLLECPRRAVQPPGSRTYHPVAVYQPAELKQQPAVKAA